MSEFFAEVFAPDKLAMYGTGMLVTLKITIISTALSYLIGIPLGVILYCTSKDSIFPNSVVNSVVGFIVNIVRSVPFIIFLENPGTAMIAGGSQLIQTVSTVVFIMKEILLAGFQNSSAMDTGRFAHSDYTFIFVIWISISISLK